MEIAERKRNIAFFQFNFATEKSVYLPYSCALLWSYARTSELVQQNYAVPAFYFVRTPAEKIVSEIRNVDIAAFSTYIWNWELSLQVAKLLKAKFPKCIVVMGGPQCPDDSRELLRESSFIDYVFHGEAEKAFKSFLENCIMRTDTSGIKGITYRSIETGEIISTGTPEKILDLEEIPSPYLTHIFDDVLKLPYTFHTVWETTRGCPYSCTFCDWGSATNSRVRTFSMERLRAEMQWFGENKLPWIYGGDANFGILARDVEIADYLGAVKEKYAYPEKFRVNFAKNSTTRVVEIARILNKQKLDKGITLSLQSASSTVLSNIKRKNLKISSLKDFVEQYQKENIATYSELILGLPGETYQSFSQGIISLLEAGIHNSLYVYNAIILPNAELNSDDVKAEFGIETIPTPLYPTRGKVDPEYTAEYQQIIVATATMGKPSWLKCHMFSWLIQTCHSLGLTQIIAVILCSDAGLTYAAFYRELLKYARKSNGFLNKEWQRIRSLIIGVLQGSGFEQADAEYSNTYWPPEELSFLKIVSELDAFYDDIGHFLRDMNERLQLGFEEEMLRQLVSFQKNMLLTWEVFEKKELEYNYAFHSCFMARIRGEQKPLTKGNYKLQIRGQNTVDNKKDYGQKILIASRRNSLLVHANVREAELALP